MRLISLCRLFRFQTNDVKPRRGCRNAALILTLQRIFVDCGYEICRKIKSFEIRDGNVEMPTVVLAKVWKGSCRPSDRPKVNRERKLVMLPSLRYVLSL